MNDNLSVVTQEDHLTVKNDTGLQQLDLENISALHTAEPAPFDLMGDYWSPVNSGESRRVLFDRIQPMDVVDQITGEIVPLSCAYFFYQETAESPIKQIRNGSKRLVGAIESYNIPRLTPLLIKYLGKIRNKNNSNLSDNWQITPLQINVQGK